MARPNRSAAHCRLTDDEARAILTAERDALKAEVELPARHDEEDDGA